MQHLKLGKRLKKVVDALGDQEKLGDALDVIGESYNSLCNYEKAKKWRLKSFKVCERVHHEEVSCFLAECNHISAGCFYHRFPALLLVPRPIFLCIFI